MCKLVVHLDISKQTLVNGTVLEKKFQILSGSNLSFPSRMRVSS